MPYQMNLVRHSSIWSMVADDPTMNIMLHVKLSQYLPMQLLRMIILPLLMILVLKIMLAGHIGTVEFNYQLLSLCNGCSSRSASKTRRRYSVRFALLLKHLLQVCQQENKIRLPIEHYRQPAFNI